MCCLKAAAVAADDLIRDAVLYACKRGVATTRMPLKGYTYQYGTSIVYPASSMGAPVSASPNHQTGRVSPLSLRGAVAMSGQFGYELDLSKLAKEEIEEMKGQVAFYQRISKCDTAGRYVSSALTL